MELERLQAQYALRDYLRRLFRCERTFWSDGIPVALLLPESGEHVQNRIEQDCLTFRVGLWHAF